MNRRLSLVVSMILLLLVLALPGWAKPQQMVLQLDPAALKSGLAEPGEAIYVCQYLHMISPWYCTIWHVDSIGNASSAPGPGGNGSKLARLAGTTLTLRNAKGVMVVRVDKVVPLYRVDSGATLAPAASWNAHDPRGETWVDVSSGKPTGRVVAGWTNAKGDGLIGRSDELVFDNGESAKILDVGVGLHATAVER